ncbi:T9SS type B sorting domain-containing protein [Flavobacterium psychrotrophum]|uniref:Ig-like domain-containing protein n=1 Tax=Flavobacterium psychrotrophum TaxID=2294119 RepID=UPI000E3239B6|nr:T9SS type B sorting domain-containing protein [Flavobacterium psychrotrophum]
MKKPISFYLQAYIIFVLSALPIYAQSTAAPTLAATGNQVYCPGTPINIVTAFGITPPAGGPTGAQAVYIQISSGYVNGQDRLTLNGTIPNITSAWNATSGKLTINSTNGLDVPYNTLEAAVQNVVYNSSNATPTGTRTFSITIGEANYLPSTQHYYRFVSSLNISWQAAKAAAAADTYYGLTGYLATLTSAEEAQLCGEQATGTGWIGGTDEDVEGVWKWATGPEAGTVFWNGGANGSTPNFAFWNTGEPNNSNNEDYAHITAPGVGILGSWNDLPNVGSTGDFVPKGYIVEYGGMPGDPVLNISASTKISINKITSITTPTAVCGTGTATLSAQSDGTAVYWYDAATGGNLLATGNSYTTPVISQPTTYYASAYDATCTTATRTPIVANVTALPTVTVTNATVNACGSETPVLEATASNGTINWYTSATAATPIGSGSPFTAPAVTGTTTFYAEALFNGCPSATREAVTVNHYENPILPETTTTINFCEGTDATLDATMANVTYLWSTGETTASIKVVTGGTYTVDVTNPATCSATRTFEVTMKDSPVINDVLVDTDRATVVMKNNDPENYEFSIDGGPYQTSPVFDNLISGRHLIMAQSINGCGEYPFVVVIYLIPKYFTPNGDNTNDFFTLAGMSALPQATVKIFDRYGKLLTVLNRYKREWDGTFNGNPLPASDYWYVIKIDNETPEIRGHFAMMR